MNVFADGTKDADYEVEIIPLVKTKLGGVLHDNVCPSKIPSEILICLSMNTRFLNDKAPV